jgi:HPt (histidine-containing phosphotransfer) domain-containing protein
LPDQSETAVEFPLLLKDMLRTIPVEGLNAEKGIALFCGDGKIYMDSLRSYVIHTPSLLVAARSVVPLENYAITVHGIKGSSYGISADMVGQWAEKLEHAARAGDRALIEEENDRFIGAAGKFITDLTNLIIGLEQCLRKPRKAAPDPTLLTKIRNAAENYDINGLDRALEELEQYTYKSDADLAAWLREQINKSEFGEITERLMLNEREVALFIET